MVVAFNNDLNEQTITLSVWQVNVPQHNCKMERLMLTHAQGYTTEQYFTEVHGGKIELTLPPLSGIAFRVASFSSLLPLNKMIGCSLAIASSLTPFSFNSALTLSRPIL